MERGDSVRSEKLKAFDKQAKEYMKKVDERKLQEIKDETDFHNKAGRIIEDGKPIKLVRFDPVKKPKHYNSGKYEVIDMIESALSALPVLPFQAYCLGNALKYICRAGLKGDFSEDIRKAIMYLNWAIGVDSRNED